MKTQNVNAKLAFNKSSVLELNDEQLNNVNGGLTPTVTTFYLVTGFGVSFAVSNTIKN